MVPFRAAYAAAEDLAGVGSVRIRRLFFPWRNADWRVLSAESVVVVGPCERERVDSVLDLQRLICLGTLALGCFYVRVSTRLRTESYFVSVGGRDVFARRHCLALDLARSCQHVDL